MGAANGTTVQDLCGIAGTLPNLKMGLVNLCDIVWQTDRTDRPDLDVLYLHCRCQEPSQASSHHWASTGSTSTSSAT